MFSRLTKLRQGRFLRKRFKKGKHQPFAWNATIPTNNKMLSSHDVRFNIGSKDAHL